MNEKNLNQGYPSLDKPWLKYYDSQCVDLPLPQCTAYDFLYQKNKDYLDDIALNYLDKEITYRELFTHIEETAQAFSALGVKNGDIVIVCSINIPETIYAVYALNKLGAISNMVDPRTNENQLREYINETNSKFIFSVDSVYPIIKNAMERSCAEKIVVVAANETFQDTHFKSTSTLDSKSNFWKWRDFIEHGRGEKPIYGSYKKDKCFVIAHTGGTSGSPKGVMLSNDAFNSIAHCYYYVPVPLERQQKYFNDLPPFIIYGLSFGIHMTLCRGLQVILSPTFNSAEFPKLYKKYKPTHFCSVPEHLNYLIDDSSIQDLDFSFAVTLGSGGDSLNPKLEKSTNEFLKLNGCKFEVTKGYGMTETASVALSTFPKINKIGSVGIPLFINTIKVVDLDSGKELGYNQSGEIWISGPSLMLGYYNNPDETDEIIVTDDNGVHWIRTGDLGRITEEGLLFHEGRIRRIYITALDGQPAKIFPTLVEKTLKKHETVYDCAVVGRPIGNSSYYEPVAYLVLKRDSDSNKLNEEIKNDLISLCKEELPSYMRPVEYRFVNELPRTSIGKVNFIALENESIKV